jgi:hypothetical protein
LRECSWDDEWKSRLGAGFDKTRNDGTISWAIKAGRARKVVDWEDRCQWTFGSAELGVSGRPSLLECAEFALENLETAAFERAKSNFGFITCPPNPCAEAKELRS